MLANHVVTQVPSAQPSIKLKLHSQTVVEFTTLAQAAKPAENGSELVGLLFGTVANNLIEVQTVRQLPVQAPGSVFERFTQKQFEMIRMTASSDPALQPFQLVGWYRFHLNGDTRLLPFEIQFHEKFFPRHEHVALILTPDIADTLRISICTRSQDGTFSPTQHSTASVRLAQAPPGDIAVDLHSGPLFSETTYIKAYEALDGIGQRQKRKTRLVAAITAAVLIGAIAVLFWTLMLGKGHPAVDTTPPLSLALSTKGTELLVHWSGGIAKPKEARLRVWDGDATNEIDLTSNFKPESSITVERHSGNIQATLVVSDGFRSWQTQSSLIDSFTPPPAPPPAVNNSDLNESERSELNRLREENERLKSRAVPARRSRRRR